MRDIQKTKRPQSLSSTLQNNNKNKKNKKAIHFLEAVKSA
jgi:hypothetical protein